MRREWFHRSIVLCICLLSIGLVSAEDKPKDEEKASLPALTDEQATAIVRITAILGTETKVDVIETPFIDVCRDIGKAHKMTITLDPAGLKKAAVTPDQLISINVKGVSLRTFLPIMLKPLGLTYLVRPDGLLITSLPGKEPAAKK